MKRKKTKYRIKNDGEPGRFNFRWLEYKKGIFWLTIPVPFMDWENGYYYSDAHKIVSQDNCEYFAKKWPYIKDYFGQEYNPKQDKLNKEKKLRDRLEWEIRYKKKNKVVHL